MICVDAEGIGAAQPDKMLFDDVSVTVSRGDRLALVGINGSGKSTLLRILAGRSEPDDGIVRFGRGVRIAMLEQDPQLPGGSVGEYLGDSWQVAAVATSLGVQPLYDRPTSELSGGQAKRVALAKVLVGDHDMIVLDEPTNHLDLEAIEWLERHIASTPAALVLVTHDRHVLDRSTTAKGAGKIVELDRGRGYVYPAEQGASAYAVYLAAREAREEQEASAEASRRILARRELAWLRRGAPARSSKPRARLRQASEIVQGGPSSAGVRAGELDLSMGTTRLGNRVVELEGVSQRYDDTTVFEGVDLVIEPGARLGVVGPNGSGKSTLLDIVAGRSEPVEGTVRRGRTVVAGYADQRSTSLDPDTTVRQTVAGPYREPNHDDRALLERFWFDTTAQFAPVRMLSGGERRRLELVMVLAGAPNLLVLDEPTNDVDLDTLRALEGFLDDWPGALVVASHDRTFLDRTVDHVLAIDDHGNVGRVPGGVEGWLRAREERTATRAPARRRETGGTRRAPAPRGPSPYTLGRQLREIEKELSSTERLRDRLTQELDAAGDHDELARLGAELADAQAAVEGLEDRWLELAEQHEHLGSKS